MKNKTLELASTAYHEAGHAVACLVYSIAVREVSIVPTAHSAGTVKTERLTEEVLKGGDEVELRNRAITLFAGEKAEERFCAETEQEFNYFCNASDILWLIDILKKFHPENKEERLRVRFELADNACDLVSERWEQIQAVARALLKHKTLSGEDVRRIAASCRPPTVQVRSPN
jgi:ATP-dependent Zn protease